MSTQTAVAVPRRSIPWDKILWIVAGLGFALGLYGLYERFTTGHLNANYGSYVPWGLWVAAYVYFVAMSAGVTLLTSLGYLTGHPRLVPFCRIALLIALATFVTGMALVWLDLGQLTRAWRLFLRTNFGSIMGLMSWLYIAYGIGLALTLWQVVRPSPNTRLLRVLAILGIPLTIAFAGGEGALFGVVGARPYWSEGLPQILFLATAILSGAAILATAVALFAARSSESARTLADLRLVLIAGILVTLLIEWASVSMTLYSAIPARAASLNLVLFGPYWWVFWIVFLGLGLVAPLLILLLLRPSALSVGIAGLLSAVGLFGSKLNLVIPGLATSELQGLEGAYSGPGLSFQYFPSGMEWLVFVWAVSMGVLLFLGGREVVRRVTRTEMV